MTLSDQPRTATGIVVTPVIKRKGRVVADKPVGETAPVAYIGRDKIGAPGDSSGERALAAKHAARAA